MSRQVAAALLISFFSLCELSAQQVVVTGGFIQDSTRLGDRIDYFLTAKYSSNLNILFPDSTYTFEPFEYLTKRYFPTVTVGGESYDSVVYQLATFEIDEIQHLSLPVYLITAKDCVIYKPMLDSIALQTLIKEPIPDSISAKDLPLKANTIYEQVSLLFNYPIVLISVGSLLIVLIIVWAIFGKRIRKHFAIKRIEKRYKSFLTSYSALVVQIQNQFTPAKTEQALLTFKKYLEELENLPYTKLTTREIIEYGRDEKMNNSLRTLDRAIYGNNKTVLEPLEGLRQIALDRFQKRLNEIKMDAKQNKS